ncbi:MAG: DNA helicase II, partial [Aquabacterium sp.]
IEHVVQGSGLEEFYKTEKEGAERLENLAELVNAAESFVTQEGFGKDAVALPVDEQAAALAAATTPDADTGEIQSPLAAFLTHAALEAGDNQAQAGQDAVQLMTVHAAKGLEFDCVFITGLEEGLFPHENSASDADSLEEERRLMYVAITRARKRLYLSFSQTRMLHGQTRYNIKSRFFDELPEETLRWLTPRNQGFGSGFARDYQHAWQRGSGLGSIVGAGRVQPAGAYDPGRSAAPVQKSSHGLRVGQSVFHTKFGEGVLVTLEGSGDDARAQINFGRHGLKWLALAVAKLTPVD